MILVAHDFSQQIIIGSETRRLRDARIYEGPLDKILIDEQINQCTVSIVR